MTWAREHFPGLKIEVSASSTQDDIIWAILVKLPRSTVIRSPFPSSTLRDALAQFVFDALKESPSILNRMANDRTYSTSVPSATTLSTSQRENLTQSYLNRLESMLSASPAPRPSETSGAGSSSETMFGSSLMPTKPESKLRRALKGFSRRYASEPSESNSQTDTT